MQCNGVFGQVDAALFFEFVAEVIYQALIKIFATQECVAVGGEHFKLLLAINVGDFDDRHVKGAAAKVIHGKFSVFFNFVDTERERGRGGLVDDAFDL